MARSQAFFKALGLSFNPRFTNEQGACLEIAPNIHAMLLVEDLPGVSARAELSPGAQFGETAVDIGLSEGPMFSGNVSLDNSSNRYTGRTRIDQAFALRHLQPNIVLEAIDSD
eukprot:gene18077-36842_t